MTARRSFLPWYRSGYAAALTGPPPAGRARAVVPAGVRLRDEPGRDRVAVPMELAGPGDVLGLDPAEVRRVEPFDGCPDFEPSAFPYVELVSPDLPWRFTPDAERTSPVGSSGRTRRRVQPWLALVVVPADDADLAAAPPGGVPILRCPAAQLPDPTESWAWAHVQVTHDAAQPVSDAVSEPGRAVARLLCPRDLVGGVRHYACLVPTFAAGRDALVPGPASADPLEPAWSGSGDVALPAYLQWEFRTGPDGSFETLVRRLRPREFPGPGGGREVAVGRPGWGAEASSAGAAVSVQGALRPVGTSEPVDDRDAGLTASLARAVSRSGTGVELRPPLYGQDHRSGLTALATDGTGWIDDLNTDPRRRIAAGLAAWAVTVHQEDLVTEAWTQLAAPSTDPALADAVGGSLLARHGGPLAEADTAVLPDLTRMLRTGGSSVVAAVDDRGASGPAGFAPHYPQPAVGLLRSIAPEWLFPAVDALPPDSVALAATNQHFVESFLVGLNHALARELVWRRYPLRTGATMVDSFWGGDAERLAPIDGWDADDDLGTHLGPGDRLVLVLRGVLLRRYPTAAVYLARPAGGAEEQQMPLFSGRIGADTTFVGFGLTVDNAMSGAGGEAWSVVIQESLSHSRFGLDDTGAAPQTWQDLGWDHAHLAGRTHVPVDGPLAGTELPASPGAGGITWGVDAAQTAVAVSRPAFRVRIPLSLWLPPDTEGAQ